MAALEMQKAAGVDVFTDGEYRRGSFMAGFASTLLGNLISRDDMRCKLELVGKVAWKVWG